MKKTKRVAIIGAGISGLSIAHFLKEKNQDVTIFEAANKPGGLIKCDIVDGVLFHKVGGHVFNSKNKTINDWFWNKFDKNAEFHEVKRNAKVLFNDKIIGYPIENNLYDIDKPTTSKIIHDFFNITHRNYDKKHIDNFNDFLKYNFGETLFNQYFEPYNKKIWGVDLETIPLPWLIEKLPMPNFEEILLSNIFRENEKKMVHSSFFYPKKNGSQFIADKLAEGLEIKYNTPVNQIIKTFDNQWEINTNNYFDVVIYTGDVRNLSELVKNFIWAADLQMKLKSLRSNGTSCILCEIDKNDFSWFYLPDSKILAHRIIYTGNFNSINNGKNKRTTCTIEFSGLHSLTVVEREIKKLPGNPVPIAFNFEPNSYVIQQEDTRENISRLKVILSSQKFYLLGRFAEWEYYNMDKAMEAGLNLTNIVLKD